MFPKIEDKFSLRFLQVAQSFAIRVGGEFLQEETIKSFCSCQRFGSVIDRSISEELQIVVTQPLAGQKCSRVSSVL
jgi:hypothetical protein